MADGTKISALTLATTLAGLSLAGAQGGASKQVPASLLMGDAKPAAFYGLAPDTGTSMSAAFAAAGEAGTMVTVPPGVYLLDDVELNVASTWLQAMGPGVILRSTDPTKDMLKPRAANIRIDGFTMQGAAIDATNSTFAILTEAAFPAPGLRVTNNICTGIDAAHGFNNFCKIEEGSDYSLGSRNAIERLWGNASGRGYGFLIGDTVGVTTEHNRGEGEVGRGRHFVYHSVGASRFRCLSNLVDGFPASPITVYATDAQAGCADGIIAFNELLNCGTGSSDGAISVFQNSKRIIVGFNIIRNAGCNGILFDSTASTKLEEVAAIGNHVIDSQYIGIDVRGPNGYAIEGNTVIESGRNAAGVSSNIRIKCSDDGSPIAARRGLIGGNKCSGSSFARSSLEINSTAPAPTNLIVKGNNFPLCVTAAIENPGNALFSLDGWKTVGGPSGLLDADTNNGLPAPSGGVSDGDKGDIVVTGSGATWSIDSAILTAFGRTLIDDADAAAGRTTLGLGTLATQNGTFSGTSSGTNSGDETASGILTKLLTVDGPGSGLDADTLDGLSSAAFAAASHTHLLAAGATDVTITAANLNALDDGADTTLHFHASDRNRANHTGTQLAATIGDSTAAGRSMLTATDAAAQTALLNAFTSALKGLVPSSGGGTTNFLRADGSWAVPAGGGGGIGNGDVIAIDNLIFLH